MATIAGKTVGATGFGLMGLTTRSPPVPQDEAFKAMKAALAAGANFWNGGEFYGTPEANSLHLLNAYFSKYPEDTDKVVLSIKGCNVPGTFQYGGDKAEITRSIENCLKLLDGKKKIDIFECARVDPKVPIEETIGYLAEFVKAGKIGGIGLSETGAATIRRAASVHQIAVVEVEYSLVCTEIRDNGVAAACAELQIPIAAYSPVGRGLLTGQLDENNLTKFQKMVPRFQGENLRKNLELVAALEKLAEQEGCSLPALAINWVKAQSGTKSFPTMIPIPGATTANRVNQNMISVQFTAEELSSIEKILAAHPVQGERYPKVLEHLNFA